MYEPIQTNNGCYILFEKIDKYIIGEIYNFLKTKLISWFDLTMCCSSFIQYTHNKMSGTKCVGRPMKNDNKVEVSDFIVEFSS